MGNFIRRVTNILFNNLHESRTAGACHIRLFFRNFFDIFFCFFYADNIRTNGNFHNFSETCFFKCGVDLVRLNLQTKLTYDGRSNHSDNLGAGFNIHNYRNDTTTLVNCTKRTSCTTRTTFYAHFVVNLSLAIFTDGYCTQSTSSYAGTMNFNNRTIGANLLTTATFYAFSSVDERSVLNNADCFFRAIIHAFMSNAMTASVSYKIRFNGALVTSRRQNIDNRQSSIDVIAQSSFRSFDDVLVTSLTKSHVNTVLQNRSFFINTATITRSILTNFLQNIVNTFFKSVFPGVARQMFQYHTTQLSNSS